MHISNIHHTLRGHDTTIKLGAVTIITGPNMSGKTSILDAIALAVAGYIPRLGKSNLKLIPALHGDDARSSVTLSNGKCLDARITVNSDGSISKDCVRKPVTPIIVDPDIFVSGTRAERVSLIAQAAGLDESESINGICAITGDNGRWKSLPECVSANQESIKAKIKAANDYVKRLTGAVQQSSAESSSSTPPPYDKEMHVRLNKELNGMLSSIRSHKVHALKMPRHPSDPRTIHEIENSIDDLKVRHCMLNDQIKACRSKLGRALVNPCSCVTCGADAVHWSDQYRESVEESMAIDTAAVKIELTQATDDLENVDTKIVMENELILAKSAVADWYRAAAELPPEPDDARVKEVEAAIQGLAAASRDRDIWTAVRRHEELMVADLQRAEKELERQKDIRDRFTLLVQKESHKYMQPILTKANRVCDGILASPLECHAFVLGREINGSFIPIEGLCGSEAKVVQCAIQCALLRDDDIKTIIIDEAQTLDDTILHKLVDNLLTLKLNGDIEQIVIAGTRLEGFDPTRKWKWTKDEAGQPRIIAMEDSIETTTIENNPGFPITIKTSAPCV